MSAAADFDRTRAHQRDASDPRSSAWVIANAGSGKTHVLTQRVIRLMLDGADPATILCLTFTKIAAAEMARRVFDTLGKWTTLGDAELAEQIEALQGAAPTVDAMRQARRLFAKALETPGGLKIQTIHAFCERLLHEFPFEANVPGQFAVLDDSATAALIAAARADVLNAAAAEPGSPLGLSVRYMAQRHNDEQIGQALDALIRERDALRRWIEASASDSEAGNVEDALADLARRLGLAAGETEETVCQEICRSTSWSQDACRELSSLSGAHSALRSIAESRDWAGEAAGRLTFFLSRDNKTGWKEGSASHRLGAKARAPRPGIHADYDTEARRVLALARRLDIVRAYDATAALLTVGDAILQAYHVAKRRAGALDFSDLIAKARNLLSRADAAQWVLYKLDRRVEHILVDEAQDTSPDQWQVVQAIAEDFFAGAGASRAPRTIFAVGDDKQSIFGFQGADPRMLVEMQHFFRKKIEDAKQAFVARPLFLSFRSTREVLDAVDTVFGKELAAKITASTYEAHASHRDREPGHVILLPRTVRKKTEEPEDWTEPYDAPSAAETELAEKIADEIARVRGTTLPSGKRVRDGEILVLVRKRDAFAAAMNRALRKRQIPTAGADRIPVSTHIAVLDLLALADVMLLPEDDLQLAACLKSPLFGVSEEDLLRLAIARGEPGEPAQFEPSPVPSSPVRAKRQGDLFDRRAVASAAPAASPAATQKARRQTLWNALRDAKEGRFKAIGERLRRWRGMADQMPPFRFFAEILGPDGGRRAFRARLGGEVDDVLDTFLSQALAYEAMEPPSLQGFVRFIRANESDIKREVEEGASGVRVMTVHGAKGLEADVVFLADTGGAIVIPGQRDFLVAIGKDRDDPAFLWRRRKEEEVEAQRNADLITDADKEREYMRLLYVAMTRARDVLYVAGVKLLRPPPFSWYTVVRDALLPKDGSSVELDDDEELKDPFQWPPSRRPPFEAIAKAASNTGIAVTLPDWLLRSAPTPPSAPEPLRPSIGLADPDPPQERAPIRSPDESALIRGRAVHRLLQFLPSLPAETRPAAADRLLAGELAHDPELLRAVREEADAVLAHPRFAELFAGEGRAEVAIVGSLKTGKGEYVVSGRIDRLLRDASGWRLVDFKTDRAVPSSITDVDPAYVLQMALYRYLLMEMEPGVPVAANLVYTAGPNVMPIPYAFMEKALERLEIRANPVP